MQELVPKQIELPADLEAIRNATDGQWLIGELRHSLELSVQHVIRMAAIVRRLEELNIEVNIKIGPLPFLRKIAYGNMSPELYVALEGNAMLLAKAGSLPTPDQDRVARNEPFKVMGLDGDFRMVPPLQMNRHEANQVFATGRIRSETEQVGYLRERLQKQQIEEREESLVHLSRKRKGVVVSGPAFLSLIELKHFVAELSKKR